MKAFEYLSVLISMILGLAIAQLLQGVRTLILGRRHIQRYSPTFVLIGFLLILDVQTWWSMFGLRGVGTWTFLIFLVVLSQTIVLYLLAALVLPDLNAGDSPLELRAHYFAHRVIFYCLLLVLIAVSFFKDCLLPTPIRPIDVGFHVYFAALALIALVTANERGHRVLVAAIAISILAYIGALFGRLS